MPKFSKRSKKRLKECHADIQKVLNEVIKYYDCTILTGHRNKEDQDAAYYEVPQRSKVKYPNSKHNAFPSLAVDVAPYPIPYEWGADWRDRVKFYELKAIIFFLAKKKGIKLRFGGDWNNDGDYKDNKFNDLVHYELRG